MPAIPTNWHPRRGEVYLVELDKQRPAVVLSVDALNRFSLDVCVVALTTVQHKNFSMRVPIRKGDGNLNFNCWAKCDQVTTLQKSLLRYPAIGILSADAFSKIEEQVKICLGFL
jgi:mRNA-degrading endonuclease toxin of MazEF toxin-antitoxin module